MPSSLGAPGPSPAPASDLPVASVGTQVQSGSGAMSGAGTGNWAAEQVGQVHAEEIIEELVEIPAATCGTFADQHLGAWEVLDDAR